MLTILTFNEKPVDSSLKEKIFYKFKKSVTINKAKYNNICMCYMIVNKKNGRIPWKRISYNLTEDTQNILCSKDICFPESFRFSRYESSKFNRMLCKNAVINILNQAKITQNKLTITLFDPLGCHYEFIPKILPYSKQVKVVTKNIEVYSKESEVLMEQYGASILVSNSTNWIHPCHVLIAPDKITSPISLPKNCIIFTGHKPGISLHGTVYYDYKIKKIPELSDIIPKDIELEYFIGAIFDIYNVINIDTIIPELCISDCGSHFITDIVRNLRCIVNHS